MTTTKPRSDVETAVADMNERALAITEAVAYALRAEPGSTSRDNFAVDALANIEDLEGVLRSLRSAVEALP